MSTNACITKVGKAIERKSFSFQIDTSGGIINANALAKTAQLIQTGTLFGEIRVVKIQVIEKNTTQADLKTPKLGLTFTSENYTNLNSVDTTKLYGRTTFTNTEYNRQDIATGGVYCNYADKVCDIVLPTTTEGKVYVLVTVPEQYTFSTTASTLEFQFTYEILM